MASYRLRWRASTKKDLRRISPADLPRIIDAAETLACDPYPAGALKLTGTERSYRLRVGGYRILHEVLNDVLIIEVIKVGHRKDVYRH